MGDNRFNFTVIYCKSVENVNATDDLSLANSAFRDTVGIKLTADELTLIVYNRLKSLYIVCICLTKWLIHY
jgi:hypothetical protein